MSEASRSESTPVRTSTGTTTRMVYRGLAGSQEWWRSSVVYVNEPPLLDARATVEQIAERAALLRGASRLGTQAVRIGCPPLPGEVSTEVMDAVDGLLVRAHRTGLRVVLRIDPHDPRDEAGAAYWLERGADGLDLGPVDAQAPVSHERYRQLHALLAAHARFEDPILSTRLSPAAQHLAAEMLHEDWLHHLVDTSLLTLTEPAQIVAGVTESLRVRGALGSAGAWLVPDVLEAGSPQLALAGALVALAMPGAVYLRQGVELGLPAKTSPAPEPQRAETARALLDEQRGVAGSHFETMRAALRLRAEHRLGLASLAWVEEMGAPIPPTVLALLSGEMLVLANLGSESYRLPLERDVLLTSGPLDETGRELPPGTTAWLWLEPAAPVRDPRARR